MNILEEITTMVGDDKYKSEVLFVGMFCTTAQNISSINRVFFLVEFFDNLRALDSLQFYLIIPKSFLIQCVLQN